MINFIILTLVIVLLILSITFGRVHPIPALLIAGLFLGIALGIPVNKVSESLMTGFAQTLKWIGLVILFGTLIGELLSASGGAEIIANRLIKVFGEKNLPLSMAFTGYLVGIPVFVDVAYLTLLPTVIVLAKQSRFSVISLGLSLTAGLTAAHALIPPTPGPLSVAAILDINVSDILKTNMLVAIGATAGGLIFIRLIPGKNSKKNYLHNEQILTSGKTLPAFKEVLPFIVLLLPLILMSLGSIFRYSDHFLISLFTQPIWALMIGVIFGLLMFNKKGLRKKVNEFFESSAKKSASVILITGAGGAFGQVIKDSQVIEIFISNPMSLNSIGILLPFLLSFIITSVTGSLTVSMITTASIIAPLVETGSLPGQITAAAIGAGALGLIHVNSSFFWLLKGIHDLKVNMLLRSFTLLSFVMSVSGLIIVLIIHYIYQ